MSVGLSVSDAQGARHKLSVLPTSAPVRHLLAFLTLFLPWLWGPVVKKNLNLALKIPVNNSSFHRVIQLQQLAVFQTHRQYPFRYKDRNIFFRQHVLLTWLSPNCWAKIFNNTFGALSLFITTINTIAEYFLSLATTFRLQPPSSDCLWAVYPVIICFWRRLWMIQFLMINLSFHALSARKYLSQLSGKIHLYNRSGLR